MSAGSFRRLAPAEILRREPGRVRPPVPPATLLPVHELSPEVFERLVLEYIWFVEAARDVHVYGRRGQRQHGLDIVGDDRSGRRLVCQVRRVKTLTPRQLRDAVVDYAGPPRGRRRGGSGHPRRFAANRFWFATSLKVDEDTRLVETIVALRDEYKGDLEIEVIGSERLSTGLHDVVGIVAALFGPDWVARSAASSRQSAQRGRRRASGCSRDHWAYSALTMS